MDTLNSMKSFLQVVESGSFVGAAERLDLSTAMVSKHVMSVEKRLGIRLLNRNSRTLSLTEPGRMYFERCKTILDDLQDAELELASFSTAPRGTLRISCPSWFATQQWANKLALFQRRYPDIVVDVSFEDRIVDLVEEGYDLALRVTPDPESLPAHLIARPVRPMAFYVAASREYLKRHAAPESPDDLAHHGFVAVGNLNSWVFGGTHGKLEVPAHTVVRYRSMAGVANAVAAGIGLAPLPEKFFEDPAFEDVLVPLLTEHPLWETTLYLVYVSRKYAPLKIRAFVDFYLELAREESSPLRGKDLSRHIADGSEPDGAPRTLSRVSGAKNSSRSAVPVTDPA
jgi:DNA-binding transcriptional LysR family regulator